MFGRMGNAGQACNAAKRMIVVDDLYDDFVEKFTAAIAAIEARRPRRGPDTFLGPLSSRAAADDPGRAGRRRRSPRAPRVAHRRPHGSTAPAPSYQPTVLTGVTPDMRAFHEELFGPVAVVYRGRQRGRGRRAGQRLRRSAWAPSCPRGRPPRRPQRVADRLDTGMVYINEPGGTAADLPFGGIKRSGVGRELGKYGMDEFVNRKLVRILK